MESLYCVFDKESKNFLNYASKRIHVLRKKYHYYVVESPFPTLRPKEYIEKDFKKWIKNTPCPEDYKIIKFVCNEEKN